MKDLDLDLFDVIAFLDDRGVDYQMAGAKNISSGWIGLSCPFCQDHSTHLGVNLDSKMYSCFRCGAKGAVVKLIQALDNCSYHRAVDTVLKFTSSDFSYLIRKERIRAEKTIFPAGTTDNFLGIHQKFISKRRYDLEALQHKYDIYAVGPTLDDWKFRIVIPVYLNNELMTYVGRDTTGKLEVPYKNAPTEKSIRPAKDCLYNLDSVKDTAIVVEGILDCWRIGNCAVATFGTQYSHEQLHLLAQKKLKRAIILFDADAIDKAHVLAHAVSSVVREVQVIELATGDPDNFTADEAWELKRELGL